MAIGEALARDLEARNRFLIEDGIVKLKTYDFEDRDTLSANPTILPDGCGSSDSASRELTSIFGEHVFDNPKPTALIQHLLKIAVGENSIILDSFAGSGTTAHAVLALNKEDGGNRKFILVECEDEYADTVTAERVRRVINGVPGARDSALKQGLGGSFTYYTLGNPIDAEGMLTGETLPEYHALASYLLHTASGISATEAELQRQSEDGLFYTSNTHDYYLLYEPSAEYLAGNEAMFNEARAKRISAASRGNGKKAIVFGAGKYMGQRELTAMGITFCQIPYEMHRPISGSA